MAPAFLYETRVTGIRHQSLNCTRARHARLVSALLPLPLDEMPSRKNCQRRDYRERSPSSIDLRAIRRTPEALIQLERAAN